MTRQDPNRYCTIDYLDSSDRTLILAKDEFVVFVLPMAIGLLMQYYLLGFSVSFIGLYFFRRFKKQERNESIQAYLYWYLPSKLLRLNTLPPSHLHHFLG